MSVPVIAILRGIRPEEVMAVGETLCAAGISVIEVPLNSPRPFESIRRLARACGDRVLVGAGTVVAVADVARVAEAGGKLVVSPDCNPEVIAASKAAGLRSWPGVMTPTEAFAALRAGADGLKLFPGEVIGPAGLKAMAAVLPAGVPVYPVGGVGPENIGRWLAAGAAGFGIGSALYRPGDGCAEVASKADAIMNALKRAGRPT